MLYVNFNSLTLIYMFDKMSFVRLCTNSHIFTSFRTYFSGKLQKKTYKNMLKNINKMSCTIWRPVFFFIYFFVIHNVGYIWNKSFQHSIELYYMLYLHLTVIPAIHINNSTFRYFQLPSKLRDFSNHLENRIIW